MITRIDTGQGNKANLFINLNFNIMKLTVKDFIKNKTIIFN